MKFPLFTTKKSDIPIDQAQQAELIVHIKSPNQTIFSGKATSVSSRNSQGNFDILPFHANFISLIENKPIIIRAKNTKQQSFTFPLAILYSHSNQVNIYTDINIKSMFKPK